MTLTTSVLALHGGPKAVQTDPGDMFVWPIITEEDEQAVLEVLRRGGMSDLDVTREFERKFAEFFRAKHALAHNTGTAALHTAMWAAGIGFGDEVISQCFTYWATFLPVLSLCATPVFAEPDPETYTLDPGDIEHRITERTRAIICIHTLGYPTDMDPIMDIAERHGLKVIEDCSHAHGTLYKGRMVGTIGHIGAMSIMTQKPLPCGEGGMLVTNDKLLYERAIAFGHYERTGEIEDPELARFAGLPWGGAKYRMHQLSSAMGRVQLRHYADRMAEVQKARNYFWDLLEGLPGIRPHRPPNGSGSTMGGWAGMAGLYRPEELGGLPIAKFVEAVRAEGCGVSAGVDLPLHLHPLLNDADIYHQGKPTRIANVPVDVRQPKGSLPVTESLGGRWFNLPGFRKHRPDVLEEHAQAVRKVIENREDLL